MDWYLMLFSLMSNLVICMFCFMEIENSQPAESRNRLFLMLSVSRVLLEARFWAIRMPSRSLMEL